MRIDTTRSRVATEETQREREYRGRIEKLERQVEDLKRRLPPEPVKLEVNSGA